MKFCVQNTRDGSLGGVFVEPIRLKNWIKVRVREKCLAHPEKKDFYQNYSHIRWLLAKSNWIDLLPTVNTYLKTFNLPFHISTHGE